MTKNTLKQLIRECIKESLNEKAVQGRKPYGLFFQSRKAFKGRQADHKDITVGTELQVQVDGKYAYGKWAVVDKIVGDTAYCTDEDGGKVKVDLKKYEWHSTEDYK